MPPDLKSAIYKIDRAQDLLDILDAEVREWHKLIPYRVYPYISPEKTRASILVKELHAPPITRWSLMIADIIHNLRCAIDHAFWAVLVEAFPSGIPKEASKLTFPIWDVAPNSRQTEKYEKALSFKIVNAIKTVQPHHYPLGSRPVHDLAVIRDIDNRNKHQLLFTAMPSVASIKIAATGLRKDYSGASLSEMYRGELENDTEAVVTTFDIPHPHMKYECTEFVAIIAIRHPTANRLGQDRDDYNALIIDLISQVRQTINDFVAFAS
jgi:hypothetical protein